MKIKTILFAVFLLFFSINCKFISELTDLTTTANELLKNIDELVRLVDTKVESGDLTEQIGELVDGRIEEVKSAIEDIIESSGGTIYDVVNGTLNNVFANIKSLLDQIKTGILDDSLPNLIQTISGELQMQISLISSSIEDIVILTFGSTFVLVDKATNSIILIASVILFAFGVIIFGIILVRKKGKPAGTQLIGVIFMGIYVVFFLCLIFITPLRAFMISGLGFGKKVLGQDFPPKIVGLNPQIFTVGKSDRIILYGNHLDNIGAAEVFFYQGPNKVFTFPPENIIVKTRNRIILGNFKGNLGWAVPPYDRFRDAVIGQAASEQRRSQFELLSENMFDLLYPGHVTRPAAPVFHILPTKPAIKKPIPVGWISDAMSLQQKMQTFPTTSIAPREYKARSGNIFQIIFGSQHGIDLDLEVKRFFQNTFQLPEGDFGVHVFEGQAEVNSPQFINIYYPPPPPPKPDISPVSLDWTNGAPVIKNEDSTLTLRLGFRHPEQVGSQFSIKISSTPYIRIDDLTVTTADISSAGANNFVDVTTKAVKFPSAGDYTFQIQVDNTSAVTESNESNNQMTQTLHVSEYIYDATIQFTTFVTNDNMDNGDEDDYRISVTVDVTGNSQWRFHYNKDGEPGHNYNVGEQQMFTGLKPGNTITINTSGYEADSGWYGDDDNMGSAPTFIKQIVADPTAGQNTSSKSYTLHATKYDLTFNIIYYRRVI